MSLSKKIYKKYEKKMSKRIIEAFVLIKNTRFENIEIISTE